MEIKWIRVEDRLPPINDEDSFSLENKISIRVLLNIEGCEMNFGHYYYDETKDMFIVEHMVHVDQFKITHWAYIDQATEE